MAAKDTPATRAAIRAGVSIAVHEYEHDPGTESYALEAAGALGVNPGRVFKTLVVTIRDGLAVCIVPSDATLDLRSLGKHVAMTPVDRAERVTGYVAGVSLAAIADRDDGDPDPAVHSDGRGLLPRKLVVAS